MPLLEVARLHAHYAHAPVLQGVSFTVDAGEIVSVFGRNGAGKTTTLRTIMGWLRPSARHDHISTARASAGCRRIEFSAAASPSSRRTAASFRH